MKVVERCGVCTGQVEADDQPLVTDSGQGVQRFDRGGSIYSDGSGVGNARQFVQQWRTEHRCQSPSPSVERGAQEVV